MTETLTTPLYRIENPTVASNPDGVTSSEELVGQWFTPSLDVATKYLRKSTQTFGEDAHPIDGAQLVVASVPTDQVEALHVSRHPVASTMDVEGDNYIVPRDGQFDTATIPLDGTVGELRGQLGRLDQLQEARRRIAGLVAEFSDVSLK